MTDRDGQLDRLRQMLDEVRANKDAFTEDTFTGLVLLLLEQIRVLQLPQAPESSNADEIRLVTVMFVDIKDSTELVRNLEASDWKAVVDHTHAMIADIVATWDGQIGQYLGDGVLCFFGAQRSRGDDAIYAVSSALAIQHAIGNYASELHQRYKIEYGLRIGISTGRVVVGMIGGTSKQELLALGPATNLAARLQTLAPVGGVLVDSATHARVRRSFTVQSQPAVELKGFDGLVPNYLILERRAPTLNLTDVHVSGIPLPFIGRERELSFVHYLSERAFSERSLQSALVSGDVGIGKSRLLQEAIQVAGSQFLPLTMCAHYEARTQPYNLLRDLLVTQCQLQYETEINTMRQRITTFITEFWSGDGGEQVAAAFGYLAGFDFVAPEGNLLERVMRWFTGLASEHRLLIVIDNLQWADEQSVALLEQLSRALARTATTILTASRPLYRVLYPHYMQHNPAHAEIELQRLNEINSREVVDSILKYIERIPAALPGIIVERAEGNPLFLHEYLGAMFENNIFIPVAENKWRFNIILYDQAANSIPTGLISVLQARLDELSPDARQLLQIASVAGKNFWLGSLKAMYDHPSRIAALLETLIVRGMIYPNDESLFPEDQEYHFRHTLYRDVAYEMLPRPQREQYHKRMAAWLLGQIAGKGEHYPLLAEQFLQAGQFDAALYIYVEAVEENMRLNRLQYSLQLIDQALGIASRLQRQDALPAVSKLWAQRGQALLAVGRFDEASAASQSALMLLEELARDQLVTTRILAERILGLSYISLGRFNDAYDALTRAHNLLPGSATGQIAAVLRAFSTLLLHQGRLEDSYAYDRRSLNYAEMTGDEHQITASLATLAAIDLLRGHLGIAWGRYLRTLAVNQNRTHRWYEALDMRYLGIICLEVFDYEQAMDYFERGLHLLEVDQKNDVLLDAQYGLALIYTGQQSQGKALLESTLERGHRDIYAQMRLHLLYIAGLTQLQEYVQAREQSLAFIQQYTTTNMLMRGKALRFLGHSGMMLGVPDADGSLRTALELEKTYGGLDLWLCYEALAQCCTDPAEKQQYLQAAAQQLQQRADSVSAYPQLRASLLQSKRVGQIFAAAQLDLPS